MEDDSVAEAEGLAGIEFVRGVHVEGGTGPAVVAAVPAGREVGVFGRIEDGDAAPFVLSDGTGLVEPLGASEMGAGFVELAFGGADFAGAIEDGHGFGDAGGEETEAGFAEGDGVVRRGGEGEFDVECAEIVSGAISGDGAGFAEKVGVIVAPAGFLDDAREDRAVFGERELFVSNDAGAFAPEAEAVDVVVGDPEGIVVRVAAGGVVGFAEFRERDVVGTVDGIEMRTARARVRFGQIGTDAVSGDQVFAFVKMEESVDGPLGADLHGGEPADAGPMPCLVEHAKVVGREWSLDDRAIFWRGEF